MSGIITAVTEVVKDVLEGVPTLEVVEMMRSTGVAGMAAIVWVY